MGIVRKDVLLKTLMCYIVKKRKIFRYFSIRCLWTDMKKGEVKVSHLCLTLCDPMDYTAHGILQERILEWVAIPFSRGLTNPGIKPRFLALRADSLPAEPQGKPLVSFKRFQINYHTDFQIAKD